jgi:acetyl-CoA carboxylase beta subunit
MTAVDAVRMQHAVVSLRRVAKIAILVDRAGQHARDSAA